MTKYDALDYTTWPKDGSRGLVVTLCDGVTTLTNFNINNELPVFTVGSTQFRTNDVITSEEIVCWETVTEHRERMNDESHR